MPLLLTPRQLTRRAELYHQLSVLLTAGIGLVRALEMAQEASLPRSFRQPIQRVLAKLEDGTTFTDALRTAAPNWLPAFDTALIEAGETSGRLEICLRYLSDYSEESARLARQVMSDLAYPAFVLHFAILLFPTSLLTRLVWQGEVMPFVLAKAAVLLPLYGIIAFLIYLSQARQRDSWRRLTEGVIRRVPVLGSACANLALARLSIALESLLNAGVPIVQAWELAATASGSPALRRTVINWRDELGGGQTPAEAVQASGRFPTLFSNLYATGEISGQLDRTLNRLYQHYQEEAFRQLRAVAQWTPRLVYFIVVLLIAYQVISFWLGYFSQISQLTQ